MTPTVYEIGFWFLLLGLIFPRLTLFISYFFVHAIPPNTVPFVIDVVMAMFVPRFLIAIYIAGIMGCNNIWFWLYIIGGILELGSGSVRVSHRSS